MSNRHPVDALADVRNQIKQLQEEEKVLLQELKQPGASMDGDEYMAWVDLKSSSTLDRKKVEEKFGRAALDGCFSSREFKTVTVRRKVVKPEIYRSIAADMADEIDF